MKNVPKKPDYPEYYSDTYKDLLKAYIKADAEFDAKPSQKTAYKLADAKKALNVSPCIQYEGHPEIINELEEWCLMYSAWSIGLDGDGARKLLKLSEAIF